MMIIVISDSKTVIFLIVGSFALSVFSIVLVFLVRKEKSRSEIIPRSCDTNSPSHIILKNGHDASRGIQSSLQARRRDRTAPNSSPRNRRHC